MKTLYVSQQGCYVSLEHERLLVKQKKMVLGEVQLPLLEQVLIFGKSQMTTQAIRACLWRNIPIVYLSRMGYCYGRIMAIERGYRQLARYQQQLSRIERLIVARSIVEAKLRNSRVLLLRQQRTRPSDNIALAIQSLDYLIAQVQGANSHEQLLGYEGAGAATYFSAFGECLVHSDFVFVGRSRRPPGNPVNAMLSFGYQVLWNHLLALIEVQGLDPYSASLHEGSQRHAALASDLIEEFRAPIVDSLVLYLVNHRVMDVREDFDYFQGGCYLSNSGRKKYLRGFLLRMEQEIQTQGDSVQPRWDLLMQQVRAYKQFVYAPSSGYHPYLLR
ncbi:MAG: CRISPR-associated endonuclease Cas1 [Chroococcales cyanobacterium]